MVSTTSAPVGVWMTVVCTVGGGGLGTQAVTENNAAIDVADISVKVIGLKFGLRLGLSALMPLLRR
jgi:hypothetical protein